MRCVHPGPFRDRGRGNYPEAVPKERSGGNGRWIEGSNWLPGGRGSAEWHAGPLRLEVATDERVAVAGGWHRLSTVSAGSRPQGGPLLGQFEREGIGKGQVVGSCVRKSEGEKSCGEAEKLVEVTSRHERMDMISIMDYK